MSEIPLEQIINHPFVIGLLKKIEALEAKISWFEKQLFGQKSERRVPVTEEIPGTQSLLPFKEPLVFPEEQPETETETVKEHQRQKKAPKNTLQDSASETGLRFGSDVRVEEINLTNPATENLKPEEFQVIDYRVKEILCQEKSSYYVKRFRQPVVKIYSKTTPSESIIIEPPVISSVIKSHYADLSLLVGMVCDKFMYHLPLYRQHQRMLAQGVMLSRATLTNWVHEFIDLFSPVFKAQVESVLASSVLSVDETPHSAGRKTLGKMSKCYYWLFYGDLDEIYIKNSSSRGMQVLRNEIEGKFSGTLLSDGYPVYQSICNKLELIHATCWAHARRYFVEAEEQEPLSSKFAVDLIREIYKIEKAAPEDLELLLEARLSQQKPLVEKLFNWLEEELLRISGLPETKYSKAVNYALNMQSSLKVYLTNPAVPIDNNHLERKIRPLVLGRKNYLFCWSELGAEKVAQIQSLILTCQLQNIDPFEYLSDVAIRIQTQPASKVSELIPRNWKNLFSKQAFKNQKY